jgi:hypothetical protein
MSKDNQSTEGIYQGVLQLIGAMLRQCAQDVKYGKVDDVKDFVDSEWFADLCDYLDVNPLDVKKRIFSGKVKQRSEYH